MGFEAIAGGHTGGSHYQERAVISFKLMAMPNSYM
jgi:hypothetical protein